jgi:PIN domain nuclease of toxin-antitoxin system
MSRVVIDTSVVMCALLREPGIERAKELSSSALMSSVNAAEVIAKCLERDIAEDLAHLFITSNAISIVDFVSEDALLTGQLWTRAPKGVLSLGDRACIATAVRLGAVAATADRIWADLDLPCPVELIR